MLVHTKNYMAKQELKYEIHVGLLICNYWVNILRLQIKFMAGGWEFLFHVRHIKSQLFPRNLQNVVYAPC